MTRIAARLVLVIPLLGLLSCDAFGPSVDPGPLLVRVGQAPAGAEGILMVVEGGPVQSVWAAAGYEVWHRTTDEPRTTIMARGPIGSGAVAEIEVPDRNVPYTVTVRHGAGGAAGGYVRQPASGFHAALARP